MIKRILLLFLITGLLSADSQGQEMPAVQLKNLQGQWISSDTLQEPGKPMVVSFWATWCKPCIRELDAIHEVLPDWKKELDFTFLAISTDDSRTSFRVAPFVSVRNWNYQIYLDTNSDLKRYLNVINIPHTLIFDGRGKLAWEHAGFAPGDEDLLYAKLKMLQNKHDEK